MSVEIARSEEGVVTVTMNRPEKLNAMTDAMWTTLARSLDELDPGGRDRVLVVTGAGGAFCAGSDVSGLLADPGSLRDRIEVSNRCVLAMRTLPIPTVARVDGVAAGSGANLALACDFVVVGDRARFIQAFVHRGLAVDSGASWLLPRLVGDRRARALALLGDGVDAGEALAMGLVTQHVPSEDLDTAVSRLSSRLRASSASAVAATKRLLDDAWQLDFAAALAAEADSQVAVIQSPEAAEAIRGFGRGADDDDR